MKRTGRHRLSSRCRACNELHPAFGQLREYIVGVWGRQAGKTAWLQQALDALRQRLPEAPPGTPHRGPETLLPTASYLQAIPTRRGQVLLHIEPRLGPEPEGDCRAPPVEHPGFDALVVLLPFPTTVASFHTGVAELAAFSSWLDRYLASRPNARLPIPIAACLGVAEGDRAAGANEDGRDQSKLPLGWHALADRARAASRRLRADRPRRPDPSSPPGPPLQSLLRQLEGRTRDLGWFLLEPIAGLEEHVVEPLSVLAWLLTRAHVPSPVLLSGTLQRPLVS
jgi:hypothetical protein